MKLAFIVHNEYLAPRVMQLLKDAGIDYYTRWNRATGKGTARSRTPAPAATPARTPS